jgi:hypothetical protein
MRDDVARLAAARAIEIARAAQKSAGPIGPQGERGEKGDQGDKGDPGPRGLPGQEGAAGAVGPRGFQGFRGESGPMGPVGPRGLQGPAGPKGERGERGEKGERGERGPTGMQGPIGPMPKYERKGFQFRFEKAVGVWGDWIVIPTGGGGGGRDDKLFDRQQTIVEMADAYKAGSLGGGSLATLTDVNLTSPIDGHKLVYHAASNKWRNEASATVTVSATPPDNPRVGDLWFDIS